MELELKLWVSPEAYYFTPISFRLKVFGGILSHSMTLFLLLSLYQLVDSSFFDMVAFCTYALAKLTLEHSPLDFVILSLNNQLRGLIADGNS